MILPGRKLLHWYVIGQPLFVTFRQRDSLPPHRAFTPATVTAGAAFVAMDRLLDQARSGTFFLRQPAVARGVLESIDYGVELGHYDLHARVIMPNHVHLLITPHVDVSKLFGSLKGSSARRANALLGRTGQAFWQEESYDHLVRNVEEFRRIRRYIENNPVQACLVTEPETYAWSSAGRPERPPQAGGLPYHE